MDKVIAFRDRNEFLETIVHKLKAIYDQPVTTDKYTWLT